MVGTMHPQTHLANCTGTVLLCLFYSKTAIEPSINVPWWLERNLNPGGSGPIQLAMSADRIQESYLKLRYKYSAIILFSSPNFLIRMRERERSRGREPDKSVRRDWRHRNFRFPRNRVWFLPPPCQLISHFSILFSNYLSHSMPGFIWNRHILSEIPFLCVKL